MDCIVHGGRKESDMTERLLLSHYFHILNQASFHGLTL